MDYLKKIRELKKEKGLSNEDIAEIADVPETTVAKIMSGTTQDPRFETITRIIIALGGSVDQILGLVPENLEPLPTRVENVVSNYADLLKSKDDLLAEKEKRIEAQQERIAHLQDAIANLRREKTRILFFIGGFTLIVLLAFVTILLVDVTNGNFGYFRY